MKASFQLMNAVILAVILTSSLSEGAPASPYAACKDGSSLCFGLGTTAVLAANAPSCVSSEHCAFFFRSTYTAASGFSFHLTAPTLPADRYIAVAMGNETGMAGLVVQCFHSSVGGKNVIRYSFNEGYHNKPIADQRSVTGFSAPSASYANGGLSCSWSAPANGKVSYKGHEDFDLLTGSYYLKLATGQVDPSTGDIHRHQTHDATGRVASTGSVNLSKTKGIIVAKEVHPRTLFAAAPEAAAATPYDQCKANTALCFGLPDGCTATGNCKFFFQSVFNSASGFTFQLIAPKIAADQYIAVGVSPQPGMSGLVVQCFHSDSAANTLQYSFNQGTDNQLITDKSQVKGFGANPVTTFTDGQLNCKWTVPLHGKVSYKDNTFDFENTQYFLKVATGAVQNGAIKPHASDGKLVSKTAMSLKQTGTVSGGGSASATAIKWHGLFFVFCGLMMMIMF